MLKNELPKLSTKQPLNPFHTIPSSLESVGTSSRAKSLLLQSSHCIQSSQNCLPIPPPFAADFTTHVVSVLDGDTIEVLHNQHPERIRLSGIDCPEKGQAFGKRAKQAASELVFGKEVILVAPPRVGI